MITTGQLIAKLEGVIKMLRAGAYDVKGALKALGEWLDDEKVE